MEELKNSVKYLQNLHFSRLELNEKVAIKALGRLMPNLNISQPATSRSFEYSRKFNPDIYKKYSWLTGCTEKNALFCFPCLLFGGDASWTKTGIIDLKHLNDKIKKHEGSVEHLRNACDLTILGSANTKSHLIVAYRRKIDKHNENVKKNLDVLSKMIDCIKFCGTFKSSMRGHGETGKNLGLFLGLLYPQNLDDSLKKHFQTSSVFEGTSKTIQNELLDCILNVCREQICAEIKKATYLAVMTDETTDVSTHCQQVIVFRYELEGKVFERFWGFFNLENKSAEGLAACITEQLKLVLNDDNEKLIAQTYDGAAVMSGERGGVQEILKETYKHAHFIHSYAHRLSMVVQKAASRNQQARIFFSNLAEVPAYFLKSSLRLGTLEKVLIKIPRGSNTRWNFNIRLVDMVFENKDAIIKCLKMLQNDENSATIRGASGLLEIFENDNFNFWLNFFHEIMPHVDILYSKLLLMDANSLTIHEGVNDFIKILREKRDNLPSIDINNLNCSLPPKRVKYCTSDNIIAAIEVCDYITCQIEEQFKFTNHLFAVKLFFPCLYTDVSYSEYTLSINVDETIKAYPMLDKQRLKTELHALYELSLFKNINSHYEILNLFRDTGVENLLIEVFSLLKIIITTPMTTAEPERCFLTLNRIKSFLRNSMQQDRLTALAMISIEKEMIGKIPDFNKKVIDKFVQLENRRMKFNFK